MGEATLKVSHSSHLLLLTVSLQTCPTPPQKVWIILVDMVTFRRSNVAFPIKMCQNHTWLLLQFSVSFRPFALFETSMTNFKPSKEKEEVSLHWCLNDKPSWQEGTERRRVSARMHYARTLWITRAQTGSAHECNSPPTLPKHYLTWQITMCESLPFLVFWQSRYLSHFCQSFTLVSHWDKETQNEPTCHTPPPPPRVRALPSLSGIVEWSRNMEQKSASHAA